MKYKRMGIGALGLMGVLAALVLFSFQTQAAAADFDGDGIDALDGTAFAPDFASATTPESIKSYFPDGTVVSHGNSPSASIPTNVTTKDLFVILVRASATCCIPDNPVEFFSRTDGGQGIIVHVYEYVLGAGSPAVSQRCVVFASICEQKAMRITESLNESTDSPLAAASYGTPNSEDLSVIYTQRIRNHVDDICSGTAAGDCVDALTTSLPAYDNPGGAAAMAFYDHYTKHTLAHEMGHLSVLKVENVPRFGGYHDKGGSGVIMEQFVKYTKKGKEPNAKSTLYISTEYAPEDVARLK